MSLIFFNGYDKVGIFFNCYTHVNNMQKEKTPNTGLHNGDYELGFRESKVCPYCNTGQINYRKYKKSYACRNCAEEFIKPIIKQVKDRRKELPVPPTLRRLVERH